MAATARSWRPPRDGPAAIPVYGPAAQLGAQVLLSRVEEMGRTFDGRGGPWASPPRERQTDFARTTCRQFTLPDGSSSARSHVPGERNRKLASLIFERDRLDRRLPGGQEENIGPLAPEGLAEASLVDRALDAVRGADEGALSARSSHGRHRARKPSLATPLPALPSRRPLATPLPAAGLSGARLVGLRRSFHPDRSAAAIDEHFRGIDPRKLGGGPTVHQWAWHELSELIQLGERSGVRQFERRLPLTLESVHGAKLSPQLAPQRVPGAEGNKSEDFGPAGERWDSGPGEVGLAVSILNYYRWMCGLKPVIWEESVSNVCQLLAESLLPRDRTGTTVPAEQAQIFRSFTTKVANFLSEGHRVSVFHGDASLASAIMSGIAARSEPPLAQSQGREERARIITERVERDRELNPELMRRRGRQSYVPPPNVLKMHELPPSLRLLRVFWELQPAADAASAGALPDSASVAQEASRLETKKSRTSRRRGRDQEQAELGKESFWGDPRGMLAFRRYILSPALTSFGAARQADTCVLWTGSASTLPEGEALRTVDAVCFPPHGFVPISLVQDGNLPWSIMLDANRFQPTTETRIRAWEVRIAKPEDGGERTVSRLCETTISDFAVDCSSRGQPFCVIFRPEIEVRDGLQLEVHLQGIRGEVEEFFFFYELSDYGQRMPDRMLYNEAQRFRESLGSASWWRWSEADASQKSAPIRQGSRKSGSPRRSSRLSVASKGSTEVKPEGNWRGEIGEPQIDCISHPDLNILSESVDLHITLRCKDASSMTSSLHLVRFSGDEEEVPRATHVMKLQDHFIVRLKFPFARSRYELRIALSTSDAPARLKSHSLKYFITTSDTCQTLLSSFDDSLMPKFGLCIGSRMAQLDGVVILSPSTYRIVNGWCYFLVYLHPSTVEAVVRREGNPVRGADHLDEDEEMGLVSPRTGSVGDPPAAPNLLQKRGTKLLTEEATAKAPASSTELMRDIQTRIREALMQKENIKSAVGNIHFDVSLKDGSYQLSLTQRRDFPELYEGWFNITVDQMGRVELFLRFPRLDAGNYAPRKLAEWWACREGQFPISF